jgi:sugar/nucleoside kinase (ribokinase family)
MNHAPTQDISIVGEINPDLILYGIPDNLEDDRELLASGFNLTLGSSSAILAHNLSLLGTRVSLTSCVGSDIFGDFCSRLLSAAGVDLTHVVHTPQGVSTGVTLILPRTTGRRILTYPGAMFELEFRDLDLNFLASARHFHISSLFLHRKLLADTPQLFAEMKRRGLTTSLDTNDDPSEQWGSSVEDLFPFLDILFCTERELTRIAKVEGVEEAIQILSDKLPVLVIKRGPHGASVYAKSDQQHAAPLKVAVVDSVGAGDTFDAGFLHQWLRGAPLPDCLEYGNLSGALSVTRSGGTEAFLDTPYRKAFFAQHQIQTEATP